MLLYRLRALADTLDRVPEANFSMMGEHRNPPLEESVSLGDLLAESTFDPIAWLALSSKNIGWTIEDQVPKWQDRHGMEAALLYFHAEQYQVLSGFSNRGPKEEAEHIRSWCKGY